MPKAGKRNQTPTEINPDMITSPLDLKRQLPEPDTRINLVSFVDLCLIGLFFTLYSSRFVFAPGVAIDLSEVDSLARTGLPTPAVLTVRDNDILLFEGEIFRIEALGEKLDQFVRPRKTDGAALLVKADKSVDMQSILRICDMARKAGFGKVQLATDEKREREEFLSSKPGSVP